MVTVLSNVFFYVPQKKDSPTCLDQHEGEEMVKQLSFVAELSIYTFEVFGLNKKI